MPIYECCESGVSELAAEIIRLYHAPLEHAGVEIDFLFAASALDENGDPTDPDPLKLHGYPCAAVCKITGAKDRAKGMADADITLDKRRWEEMGHRERKSLLDHEITHLELTGKTDEYGRPKLKMRLHDREMGWFDSIAARWGEDSNEVKQAAKLNEDAAHIYFQPELALGEESRGKPTVTISSGGGGEGVTLTSSQMRGLAKKLAKGMTQR